MDPIPVPSPPEPQAAETVEERFRRLAAAWREATPYHARHPVRYDHPIYREIVGLGPAVVPFLLRALQEYPRDWFWALHLITRANPVAPEERGAFTGMSAAWLRWGREHGYLPEASGSPNGNSECAAPSLPLGGGPAPTLEEKFHQLAAIWRAETCYLSSTTAMVNHPAYQEIIDLGPAIVPLVLRELEQRPAPWFSALRALTGADPMDPADRGKIRKIAAAWLRWGKANGYQW